MLDILKAVQALRIGAATLAAAALLGACAGTPSGAPGLSAAPAPAGPRTVSVNLSAARDVNPGPSGQAAPVSVRLFTMRSLGAFNTSDFFAVRGGSFGGQVIDSRTVTLRPGTSRAVQMNAGTDGAFLGVAAGFRDIASARWRATTSLGSKQTIRVSVRRASVSAR